MGWETSDRRDDLPADWPQRRKEALDRDGWRCRWILPSGKRCPRKATDVDHMGKRTDHRLERLRSLCGHHHGKVTAKQGWYAKAKRKEGRKKSRPMDSSGWSTR